MSRNTITTQSAPTAAALAPLYAEVAGLDARIESIVLSGGAVSESRVAALEASVEGLLPQFSGTPVLSAGETDYLTESRADLGPYATWVWRAVVRNGSFLGQIATAEIVATGVANTVHVNDVGTSSVLEWSIDANERVQIANRGTEECQIEYWGIRIR